jgi:Rad3-related DNA helicase
MEKLAIELDPSVLDLPPRFESFRPAQSKAIEFVVSESTRRCCALGLPTGSGKSLLAMAIAKLFGGRAVYLTATRGLEDQIHSEFSTADVRGRQNYSCREVEERRRGHFNCEQGAEEGCLRYELQSPSCPYFAAVAKAKQSNLISTNYSYWLHAHRQQAEPLGPVDLLICDEAHAIPEELGRFLQVHLTRNELLDIDLDPQFYFQGIVGESTGPDWYTILSQRLTEVRKEQEDMARSVIDYRRSAVYRDLESLRLKLIDITRMSAGHQWTWQIDKTGATFDSINPSRYASALLYRSIPRVLLMSATLRPYSLRLCGLEPQEYDFLEWPAVFPPQNGPVYHIPTVGLNYKSTAADYQLLIDQADRIISRRLDRKGIVHTGSYDRARLFLRKSKYANIVVTNDSGADSAKAIAEFKSSAAPRLLVSPSFATGYDFPGSQCEYQIILKCPFPDTTSLVMSERCKDPDYRMYVTMQQLVQMCGRGRRYHDDRCENFILDNKINWLMARGRKFAPASFKVWTQKTIPHPPPAIESILASST